MPVYSHSKLAAYENCPWQYKLNYIDKLEVPQAGESIEAFLGSRVHETLEKLHKELILTKLNSLEELLRYYGELWDKNWHENVVIVKKEYTKEHYFNAGREAITGYYRRYHPFDQSKTLATERLLALNINEYSIRGVIDRLAYKGNGIYEIHDYKVSGYLPPQGKFERDRQLALYQIGVKEEYRDATEIRLIWHYLLFDKEITSTRTDAQLEDLKKEIVSLIRTIEKDTKFEPKESALCDWCEYPEHCPAKKHELATRHLEPNEYLNEPGVSLVNQYAAIKAQIRELSDQEAKLQEELDLIEEAVVQYARKNEITKIIGSDFALKVTEETTFVFPKSADEGRSELEECVKQAGIWGEVSGLNLARLSKLLKDGRLDESTRDQLMKFAANICTVSVRLVKKKDGDER